MLRNERYVRPVGFASEPRQRRWLWVRRMTLAIFVFFLGILLYFGVINPDQRDTPGPTPTESVLPGPR